MKNVTRILFLGCISLILVQSCSRKNTFINRAWHSVGTEYNILYNGGLALDKGLVTVNNAFTENFWELLPVERFEAKDEVRLSDTAENSDFELAEEKAVKAIQRHSMIEDGKEKNPQMDEAYLLLGKARYYDQRFVPALAAFNSILNKYPTSDKINQVKVWREKSNLRLGYPELTIKNLKRYLEDEEVKGQDLADITAVLADAYLAIKQKDTALKYLDTAAINTRVNTQKARYNFIRGQLYNSLGKKDSANLAFDEIIDLHRKIPRPFYINAHLQKASNFDFDSGDKDAFFEHLKDLEENRENRPFLDKIYHQIAEFHRINKSDSLSEVYYNKSLLANKNDAVLNTINYLTLGNMYFEKNAYKIAGAYYDSTLVNMVENSKQYRTVKKKRENLDDVIYYESVAKTNDSILHLVNLPKEQQLIVFNNYIEDLKAEAKAAKEAEEIQKAIQANSSGNSLPLSQNTGNNTNSSGNFYFYNQTILDYGKDEFKRLWGNRTLQDNWRFSSSVIGQSETSTTLENSITNATEEERYNPEFYINSLPTEPKVIDSIGKARNFAYYQLGLIYKEKFKEYHLAVNKLETLLTNNPEERLILPSKYNLYKLYTLLGRDEKALIAKQKIIAEHPQSRYAELLLNPQSELSKDENSPETIYKNLYKKYEAQDYASVISEADKHIKQFEGDGFMPKFEILKASALGRLQGFEAYKEALNYVTLTYPNSEEGKQAQKILTTTISQISNKDFLPIDGGRAFNVIYQFNNSDSKSIDEFVKNINKIISKISYYNLSVSKDVYTIDTTFVVVHGLESYSLASTFNQILLDYKDDNDPEIIKTNTPISSYNYTIVQRHKNLTDYLTSN